MTAFGIERVGRERAALLADIHAAAFPPSDAWSADIFGLQLALPNVIGLSDSRNGLILLRVAGDEAEILTLAVRPESRRLGVGSRLLQEAVSYAGHLGVTVIFLEVSTKNTPALELYRQSGFIQAGLRRRYYSDGSDALVQRLDLPAPAGGAPASGSGAAANR
ncbi:GNAT family N-acetyltransferase [Rhodopila sp.]|jgi:ribosomal-protein-alanine N-acetyltransferase|uniref:GNAT family N-acetyltransferase n=1 Tax=Rhodopila sp. TaxID=2480087 RepID=UPI002D1C4970|nr:GNAT family N-acetyltransferase [Rhodopila sp.]HVZ07253.1 GNAT family N-acetyltransferase [Rhodopila sp.]